MNHATSSHNGPGEHEGQITSGKATAALIFGIVSFIAPFIASVPAIVLGVVAKRDIEANENFTGRGLATAGLVLGIASVLLWGFFVFSASRIA